MVATPLEIPFRYCSFDNEENDGGSSGVKHRLTSSTCVKQEIDDSAIERAEKRKDSDSTKLGRDPGVRPVPLLLSAKTLHLLPERFGSSHTNR